MIQCYIFAGLGGIFCAGGVMKLETAVDRLNYHNPDLDAKWRVYQSAPMVAQTILKQAKPELVILMGHSMGVPAALDVARTIGGRGIMVDYFAAMDPTAMPYSTGNIAKFTMPENVVATDQFLATYGWPAMARRRSPDGGRGGMVHRNSFSHIHTEVFKVGHVALASHPRVEERILEMVRDAYSRVRVSAPVPILGNAFVYQRPVRAVNELVWHCTADKEGVDNTVENIRRFHMAKPPKGRGWSDIGYHFVVYRDGSIHSGRPLGEPGAHVEGNNSDTIGCAYVGGVDKHGAPKDTRTAQQRVAMRILTNAIVSDYRIKTISGHNQYSSKACPSFDVRSDELGNVKGFRNGKRIG